MKMSENIIELAAALSKFQGKVSNPNNSKTAGVGGKFSYKYAPLDEILNLVRPLLSAEGLSLIQSPVREDGFVGVKTLLLHTSGQYIEFEPVLMPLEKHTAQGVGAAITYSRRYSMSTILGIASEDDDDAISIETSSQGSNITVMNSNASTTRNSVLSEKQVARLYAIATAAGISDIQVHNSIKTDYKKDSVKDLTRKEYDAICNRLEAAKK